MQLIPKLFWWFSLLLILWKDTIYLHSSFFTSFQGPFCFLQLLLWLCRFCFNTWFTLYVCFSVDSLSARNSTENVFFPTLIHLVILKLLLVFLFLLFPQLYSLQTLRFSPSLRPWLNLTILRILFLFQVLLLPKCGGPSFAALILIARSAMLSVW